MEQDTVRHLLTAVQRIRQVLEDLERDLERSLATPARGAEASQTTPPPALGQVRAAMDALLGGAAAPAPGPDLPPDPRESGAPERGPGRRRAGSLPGSRVQVIA